MDNKLIINYNSFWDDPLFLNHKNLSNSLRFLAFTFNIPHLKIFIRFKSELYDCQSGTSS